MKTIVTLGTSCGEYGEYAPVGDALRPLSQAGKLQEMYARRAPLYARFADQIIDNNGTLEDTLKAIKEALL